MRRVSKKRASQLRKYNKRVKEWKEENPDCKAQLENCTGWTIDNHHQQGREGERLNDESNWLPVCRNCHNDIGLLPIDEQIEKGLSKSKHRVA